LDETATRNVTLKCLSEIAGLTIGPEYNAKFVTLFVLVMAKINNIIPPNTGKSDSMPHGV
jgi:exportin-1